MKILTVPHKMLYQKADPVSVINAEINGIIDRMLLTMYQYKGVGLAANQVGISLQIVVINIRYDAKVLINPVIIGRNELESELVEGCLSIPGFTKSINRPTSVFVESVNRFGHKQDFEANGLLARCIQHECCHLEGKLINDNT
jgi:peptide deformylase